MRLQRYTMERGRLQTEANVYLTAPKEEALVPIENSRSARKNVKKMPNVKIANWIAGKRRLRQRIRKIKITNIIVLAKEEAELQILDDRFKKIIIDATRNITTIQR